MANIRTVDLPADAAPSASDVTIVDGLTTRKTTLAQLVNAGRPLASQSEAEAGTEATKAMTALTVKQAIAAQGAAAFATYAQGTLADSAVQPGDLATVATSGDYDDLSGKPTLGTAAATDAADYATAAQAVPSGGTAGQVLAKVSGTDNDLEWTEAATPLVTSLSGSVPADPNLPEFYGYAINEWRITDTATVGATPDPSRQVYAIHVNYLFGGETLRGTRNALSVYATLTEPSEDAAGQNQNYVAGQFITMANSADNGTDTGSGAKGAVFALNPVAILQGDAENMLHLSCGEFNIAASAGCTVRYKSLINFANYPTDAEQGSEVDAGLWFYKQGAEAVGFRHGILFSDEVMAQSGLSLVASDGTFMAAEGGGTAANGFDFSDWNFTQSFLRSKGFEVTGAGQVYATGEAHVVGDDGAEAFIQTGTLPDALGDNLGWAGFGYQNQSTLESVISAYIQAVAGDEWTEGSNHPSILRVFATPYGTVTPAEQARIAPDATADKSPLWLLINGALKQVTVGAPDSGGAGYRQLIVENGV